MTIEKSRIVMPSRSGFTPARPRASSLVFSAAGGEALGDQEENARGSRRYAVRDQERDHRLHPARVAQKRQQAHGLEPSDSRIVNFDGVTIVHELLMLH